MATHRLGRLGDRALDVFGGFLILFVVALLAATVWLTYQVRNAEHQHTQDIAQIKALATHLAKVEAENHATLGEVAALQRQVSSVIDGLPAADAYLGKLAWGLESQIQSLCNADGASCADLPVPLPPLGAPAAPHPSPAPTPHVSTTTTVPGHHGRGRH